MGCLSVRAVRRTRRDVRPNAFDNLKHQSFASVLRVHSSPVVHLEYRNDSNDTGEKHASQTDKQPRWARFFPGHIGGIQYLDAWGLLCFLDFRKFILLRETLKYCFLNLCPPVQIRISHTQYRQLTNRGVA